MEKRKAIAVIAADVSNDYMNRICAGISGTGQSSRL